MKISTLKRNNRSGFSWIEVVAGVGVAAIVVAAFVPNLVQKREEAKKTSCIANLKSIDGAKQQWAVDKKKKPTTIPTEKDLYGDGLYIKFTPECPTGGKYSINAVNAKPTCSVEGHSF
jgi:competence protein ComGC